MGQRPVPERRRRLVCSQCGSRMSRWWLAGRAAVTTWMPQAARYADTGQEQILQLIVHDLAARNNVTRFAAAGPAMEQAKETALKHLRVSSKAPATARPPDGRSTRSRGTHLL